ncbi:hypothetical protein SVAN01_11315 [Stagonosporopsis vannaccii]|nr:hypothetical protein SVAN01_11315 [Stagonosporopsis vannaccii]
MREPNTLMLLLFRTAYLYTMIIYAACAALGFPGSHIGLAAAIALAVSAELAFVCNIKEEIIEEKELRYMV